MSSKPRGHELCAPERICVGLGHPCDEIERQRDEVRAMLLALLAQMDRDLGLPRQGVLSNLRRAAAPLVDYES